ncbi:uncharacterized protein H6S33_012570 [Morchella sextelata]|uniref:uncharacterized protein n=1 Tax=Morchella sextelata TaxID=1174677 RepID=UPI001D041B51|nr:uncharacterized protein H6S33_012570 [Morchella sextelata]KAH0610024.1 hypothetical protein H6S33_012570 [Morchella sextelata]
MNIPGERFTIPLESDSEDESPRGPPPPQLNAGLGFIRDIVEKPVSSAPTAPVLPPNATSTGFPAHKKRGPSKFRQRAQQDLEAQRRRQAAAPPPPPPPPPPPASASASARGGASQDELTERQRISDENDQRIAAMSAEEIDEERQELLKGLSPALIERLLKKSTLNHGAVHGSFNDETEATQEPQPQPQSETPKPAPSSKKVSFDPTPATAPPAPTVTGIGEDALPPPTHVHFPRPPTSKDNDDLDPSDPEFFTQLHTKYFPSLPADPSKLAWMNAPTAAEDLSYHPSQTDLPVSALRFDFRGDLLPPRKSRELPANLGLHHHADAPNAAGYTVPELARLARSAFPTQRCMAMQMLGRILYKLGMGHYGVEDITQGLWRCMEEGRVIAGLEEAAAGRQGGHLSVKAYATDALWLWQKGGGHRWKAE